MSNRHLARTIALQSLYQWDFNHQREDMHTIVAQNLRDFAPSFDDGGFTVTLVTGILSRRGEIDPLIARYAPEWPLDQIPPIDRNILRIGIYELKTSEVPPKVAINESIELAKTFGGESSSKFVNGVLGNIYKDMETRGERVSTPTIRETQAPENPDPASPAQEVSAGGVVFRKDAQGAFQFALIQDAIYRWTFPKGHVEAGESLEQTACAEVGEEIGIKKVRVICPLGKIHITVNTPGKSPVPKVVHYFLMEAQEDTLHIVPDNEIKGGDWVPQNEVLLLLGYENAKEIFRHALKQLNPEQSISKTKINS